MTTPNGSPNGPTLGFVSDTHVGQSFHLARVRTCLDWMQANAGPQFLGLAHGGDGCESPSSSFLSWARDPDGGGLPETMPIWMAPGNHDTETEFGSAYGETPASPHATMLARYDQWCGGSEWYSVAVGNVNLSVVNNLSDYLTGAGQSAYHNANPIGLQYTSNPDHGGITDPASPQRQWIAAQGASGHRWQIMLGHRALWAPFDADPRRLNVEARAAVPITTSLVLGGDIHVGSLSGPWRGDTMQAPGHGAYALTLAGGYVVRQVQPGVIPPSSILWESGGAHASGLCQAALIEFGWDTMRVQIFECCNADPVGGVVYTTTLERNRNDGQ